jgi:hypothetical protein
MASMAQVSRTMQTLLTTTADAVAQQTGVIQRQRRLTGARLAQALILGWLAAPQASLAQLAQTAVALGTGVSRQALDQRFGERLARFLRALLDAALSEVLTAEPAALPLLGRFAAVVVLDSTTIRLPDAFAADWPGCGGSTPTAGAAALKLQVRLDLRGGQLTIPDLEAGRQSDQTSQAQHAPLPAGALRLADLGYFALPVLRDLVAAGGHYLSRVKGRTVLHTLDGRRWSLPDLLAARCPRTLDLAVSLGTTERLACRLLAQRLPPDLVAVRHARLAAQARRDGETLSAGQVALLPWAVLITDLPASRLRLEEAMVLYRLRWQIELLFKLWKSQGRLATWRSRKPWHCLAELWAKLTGLIIQHWLLLACCWGFADKSLWQAAQTIRAHAMPLVCAFRLGSARRLRAVLALLGECLAHGCRIGKRRAAPPAYLRLLAFADQQEVA